MLSNSTYAAKAGHFIHHHAKTAVPGRGLIENNHSTDVESTNRVRASMFRYERSPLGQGILHKILSACSQWPACQALQNNQLASLEGLSTLGALMFLDLSDNPPLRHIDELVVGSCRLTLSDPR